MLVPVMQLIVEEAKDNYSIDLSFAIPECTHLPKEVIDSCLINTRHKAVNPHAQRLVAAATKSTQPVPKADGKPKQTAKGKAKGKAKAKAKTEKGKEEEEKEVSEYSQARNKFMNKPESLIFKLYHGHWWNLFPHLALQWIKPDSRNMPHLRISDFNRAKRQELYLVCMNKSGGLYVSSL